VESEGGNDGPEEKILAPAGVGVNGGGLSGDSAAELDFDAALRFFAGTLALPSFSYVATPFCPMASDWIVALLLATRAERLRDML
jgi:hypothetical protein